MVVQLRSQSNAITLPYTANELSSATMQISYADSRQCRVQIECDSLIVSWRPAIDTTSMLNTSVIMPDVPISGPVPIYVLVLGIFATVICCIAVAVAAYEFQLRRRGRTSVGGRWRAHRNYKTYS